MLPDGAKYLLPRYTRGQGLELGCGETKTFAHFIGIENGHRGRLGADLIEHYGKLGLFADESVDFVVANNIIGGMKAPFTAICEWLRVIKPEGHLILFWQHETLETDLQHRKVGDAIDLIPPAQIIRHDVRDDMTLMIVAKTAVHQSPVTSHQSPPVACIVRLGAFGDMLQTAALFPRLREQGFHVEVLTTPKGKAIIEHDPNVDSWHIVDPEQIPNGELSTFFYVQADEYDRFVNLSESVEGSLLALPGRAQAFWPDAARRLSMDHNYFDLAAAIAGVKFRPCQLFYPTTEEEDAADERIEGAELTVLWALSGSSLHKFYPHMDAIIARLLIEYPKVRIFLTGDETCKILEASWRSEPRVVCLSGEIGIRETLALAQSCDLVIGPETGVLNAVAYDDQVGKVLFLSHSSANNLSKHWKNTIALSPEGVPCWPCHKLIFDRDRDGCPYDEKSGASLCAFRIDPSRVWEAIVKLRKRFRWSWR